MILIPIYLFNFRKIRKEFELSSLSWLQNVKVLLFMVAFLSDNLGALFLVQPKHNFENIFYYSHFFSMVLMVIGMLIPSKELNFHSEFKMIRLFFANFSFSKVCKKKNKNNDFQMVPLNTSDNETTKPVHEIDIPVKADPEPINDKDYAILPFCFFTLFFIFSLILCFNVDFFAKTKKILSLMDTPKLIDFFNYPIFFWFMHRILGKNSKNLIMNAKRKISQGLFDDYFL